MKNFGLMAASLIIGFFAAAASAQTFSPEEQDRIVEQYLDFNECVQEVAEQHFQTHAEYQDALESAQRACPDAMGIEPFSAQQELEAYIERHGMDEILARAQKRGCESGRIHPDNCP